MSRCGTCASKSRYAVSQSRASYKPSCSGCGFSGGATGSWNGICVIGTRPVRYAGSLETNASRDVASGLLIGLSRWMKRDGTTTELSLFSHLWREFADQLRGCDLG